MPIISKIGRKSPRVRTLLFSIYIILTLGSITMVYPLLIMVAGSTKSGVDVSDFSAVPAFLYDNNMLYRKHIEGLFNESLDTLNMAYDADVASFETLDAPQQPNQHLAMAWGDFLDSAVLPDYAFGLGYTSTVTSQTVPRELRKFKKALQQRFNGNLEDLNRDLGTEFVAWHSMFLRLEDYALRRDKPTYDPYSNAFRDFKMAQPAENRYVFCIEGFYKRLFLKPQYTRSIDEYNHLHGTAHASYADVHLPARYPAEDPEKVREDWEIFVRNTLNLLWTRAEPGALAPYQAFLEAKYRTVDGLNRRYETDYASFADVPLIEVAPAGGVILSDWESFVAGWQDPDTGTIHQIPIEFMRIRSAEVLFRAWLMDQYGDIAAINRALQTDYVSTPDILPPQDAFHWFAFLQDRSSLRSEFITRNYKTVLDYMLFHGRGIYNTVVYCALAIALALLINPLAAYAMSRFRMPTTYKILLFLLLTMAFPPMVTQIPVFLMLRELGLLNTFAALLLPGMANGYAIFLLKGFFDSLGTELYESAQIDGASEWVMFWNITMALSKPILAVVALNTFTMAYANFMFALLLCQDQKMWTLMVWLYQLQGRSGLGVIYASLIIAGIPTLLVFVFCQNIIMRGIVVPVEK